MVNLGKAPLIGVEGRWAEGAREMELRHSWFVPTLNFEPHITKPLIPFWLIKISGKIFGFNEFSVRLPGALLALFSVFSFYILSKKLFGSQGGFLSTLCYAASLGFLEFSRLAQSEIYQLFGIINALTVYVYFRKKTSFLGYFLFFISLNMAALSKGLTAFAVLTLFVITDLTLYRRYYHLNFKFFIAFLIGFFLYFVPYYLTAKELNTDLPFYLWFRENIKQAIDPYDNLRPFYIYLYFWPLWITPLIFFLYLALYKGFKRFKELSEDSKLFLFTNLFIFFLFTLAKARRGYYILPILPFTLLYLNYFWKDFLSSKIFIIYKGLTYLLPVLATTVLFYYYQKGSLGAFDLIFSLSLVFIQSLFLINFKKSSFPILKLIFLIFVFWIAEIIYFVHLKPNFVTFSEKEAGRRIYQFIRLNPGCKVCSFSPYKEPVANVYFYGKIERKITNYQSPQEALKVCDVIVIRKKVESSFLKEAQEKGFKVMEISSKDSSKRYFLFYNSSTLKTPSF